jgi:hypothetical protein
MLRDTVRLSLRRPDYCSLSSIRVGRCGFLVKHQRKYGMRFHLNWAAEPFRQITANKACRNGASIAARSVFLSFDCAYFFFRHSGADGQSPQLLQLSQPSPRGRAEAHQLRSR